MKFLCKHIAEDLQELIEKARKLIPGKSCNDGICYIPYVDEWDNSIKNLKFIYINGYWEYSEA